MILKPPFIITGRLLPGLKIGDAVISIDYLNKSHEDRKVYNIWIDGIGKKPYNCQDLRSGCFGGNLQEGMESLLSFLGAAAESHSYRMRTGQPGENEHLFPKRVVKWAYQNSDEIDMLRLSLEETPNLIDE